MTVKRLLAAVLCGTAALLLSISAAKLLALPAQAAQTEQSAYARILRDDVYLYESAQEDSGLFILPRTYFVRITGEAGDYYKVEYLSGANAAVGYCRADEVELVDYIPETPFLSYETEVTFTAGGGDLPEGFITEYTVPAAFYGTFYYGSSVYCYVLLNGEFGYVPASACSPLNYPENTEHMQEEDPEQPQQNGGNANAVNIVLICALSMAALGAVYFLFRPARPERPHPAPFDDYEQPD